MISIYSSILNGLMPIAIFTTYVYLGNVMTIANTMLATQMFDRIKGPIQRIPNIINNWVEVGESVERLQEFLQCEERQPNVLMRKEG